MNQQITQLLNNLEINYRIVEHEAVFTVEQANKAIGERTPIKNLLLVDKGGKFYLVVMSGDKKLDLKVLADKIDSRRLSFASGEQLLELFQVAPGAVSIFGLINPAASIVKVILDQAILADGEAEVGFHPNDNTKSVFIKAKEITRLINHFQNPSQIIAF